MGRRPVFLFLCPIQVLSPLTPTAETRINPLCRGQVGLGNVFFFSLFYFAFTLSTHYLYLRTWHRWTLLWVVPGVLDVDHGHILPKVLGQCYHSLHIIIIMLWKLLHKNPYYYFFCVTNGHFLMLSCGENVCVFTSLQKTYPKCCLKIFFFCIIW